MLRLCRRFEVAPVLAVAAFSCGAILAQELKPADSTPDGPVEFPAPGESPGIGKQPKTDGKLAQFRRKYFYLGELTWRGGVLLSRETSDWAEGRKNSIEQDIFRRASSSNNSTNVAVPLQQNPVLNYMVGIEGLLGVNLHELPGFKNWDAVRGKQFLRIGFHGYIAPFYKKTTQSLAGDFAYFDALALTPTRTYPGTIEVDENLLTFAPGMSFFLWYEKGFFSRKLMPYTGFEIGAAVVYGKRKYRLNAGSFTTVEGTPAETRVYSLEANLQESIINDFGFRFMPAMGFQYHITSGHYVDVRIGYQILDFTVTLNRRGSLTEMKRDAAGNFAVTWSEDFLVKSETRRLTQTGLLILLGYTAGLF
ncbi:MAG: hypothetical protein N2Z22_00385 [Turneriella sp.]|nr:hypothetical protein [Turneriella sp.]